MEKTETFDKLILDHIVIQAPGASLSTLHKSPLNQGMFKFFHFSLHFMNFTILLFGMITETRWKMVLHIPIEGGHENGRFKVELGSQIRLFSTSSSSEGCQTTLFYSDCAHQFEEVTFGWRMAFVFNLNVKTFQIPTPFLTSPDLPSFLSINSFRDIINRWPQSLRLLALPLDHLYSSPPKFCSLKGRDRAIVQLFRSVDGIDLHLVELTLKEVGTVVSPHADYEDEEIDEESTDEGSSRQTDLLPDFENILYNSCPCCKSSLCKCYLKQLDPLTLKSITDYSYETSRWTRLDDQPSSSLNLQVNYQTEILSRNRKALFDSRQSKPAKKLLDFDQHEDFQAILGSKPLMEVSLKRAFLVLTPKSFSFMLHFNFQGLLNHLDELQVLYQVINSSRNQPELVWQGKDDNGAVTLRLINHCIASGDAVPNDLKLELLDAIASNFSESDDSRFEGVKSPEIASAVAQLVVQMTWSLVDPVIEKLFTSERITKQLENLVHLSLCLLNARIIDGAIKTCQWIGTAVNKVGKAAPKTYGTSAMVAYIGLRFRIHGADDCLMLFNLEDVKQILYPLGLNTLFEILELVNERYSDLLIHSQGCRNFRSYLHGKLSLNLSYAKFMSLDLAERILLYLVAIDDYTLLKEFIHLRSLDTHGVLKGLLSSAEVWNKCLTTNNGQWTIRQLTEKRISLLSRVHQPLYLWSQPAFNMPETVDDGILLFLRGYEHIYEVPCEDWKSPSDVDNFISSNFGDLKDVNGMTSRGFSVIVKYERFPGTEYYTLRITKTCDYYFKVALAKFNAARKEIMVRS